ncbi:MAG TPA: type ISP restriction/modification enzyme [Candidatus Acidoferrales bacterium]|nr:type ISP restriction/modification enzyme [Candidatus Acidoferrales bacterium]
MDLEHIEHFFTELRDIHQSGVAVKETSYYPCLSNLFNATGKKLKPRVRCIIHPRSIGAGLPDGAFLTADQKSSNDDPLAAGLIPARGVLEIKSAAEEAGAVAGTEQVRKYLAKYGLVLVTNFRQFMLISRGSGDAPEVLESFTIAASEKSFWKGVQTPESLTKRLGASLHEFLTRVMLHAALLTRPQEVAWFLASYARDARARIEATPLPGLATLRSALEGALGLKFEGEQGEHFFRSSLVQTLFYGVFSAWVLWSKRPSTTAKDKFNWHEAAWSLHVPAIKTLFEQLATPSKLQELGIEEVLNWTQTALNRVVRAEFFSNFEEEHAVLYFYEPFLAAFDPDLRRRLGVWFTPPEIVKYIVARIDRVLRDELGLANGLADPAVLVLDPCCGTGAFLVEVLRRIEATLRENGGDSLTAQDVKSAAIERIFGFELLPAPFVVAHLQLGLYLQSIGSPLSNKLHERVGVYLTNALTGWNPPKGPKQKLIFPELEEERDAADLVKRDKKILVVLGNPPYFAFAGVSPEEEQGLVEPYKEGLFEDWNIRKYNLDELYIRFLRLGERRIADMSRRGVVCYISNYSYLSDASFVVLRKRFSEEFNAAWIDCLNGDSRETGKLTPDCKPDPSVFSTSYNREGIRLGTTVGLFVKSSDPSKSINVRYRDFWGTEKRAQLLGSLQYDGEFNSQYQKLIPSPANWFSLRPSAAKKGYDDWPSVIDFADAEPISGLQEMRRGALMAHDAQQLEDNLRTYFDKEIDWTTFAALQTGLSKKAGAFNPEKAREKLRSSHTFDAKGIRRYALYPFDVRWCYYTPAIPLWNRPRPELLAQLPDRESFFVVRRFAERPKEGRPAAVTSALPDYHLLRPNAVAVPMRLRANAHSHAHSPQTGIVFDNGTSGYANLSSTARAYLSSLTDSNPDSDEELSRLLWFHSLATIYAPAYLAEHAQAIRGAWPRIPLPDRLDLLQDSAQLGRTVAALLDTETPALGVTTGKLRRELSTLGRVVGPKGNFSLAVKVGWGHLQKDKDIVMPGRGLTAERPWTDDENTAIADGAEELGLSADAIKALWGKKTLDIYLSNDVYWSNIPKAAWNYAIGGYFVLKKWLSYREKNVLGRDMTKDEAREFTQIVRRVAALLLLEQRLDSNYLAITARTYAWPARPKGRQ